LLFSGRVALYDRQQGQSANRLTISSLLPASEYLMMTKFFLFCCMMLVSQAKAAEITADCLNLNVPLLIRNEENPAQRLTIENSGAATEKIKSISISLKGSDDLADLDRISIFHSKTEKYDGSQLIARQKPEVNQIQFKIDIELKPGKNYFWISSRLNPNANLLHKISILAYQIETTSGVIKIASTTGRISARVVGLPAVFRIGTALRKHQDDGVHTYRIPALTTTKNGTLLAVYDMRRRMGRDLQEDIDIGLSRSTDGGQMWEPVKVIMDMGEYGGLPQELNGCSDPGIIVDRQTGTIFCFAVWMNGKPGKHQWRDDGSEPGFEIGKSAQMLMVKSTDDGKTWTKPENLTRQLKKPEWWLLAPAPQSGIQIADGTLVMPVQGRTGRGDGETFATVMTSRDHGQSWKVGAPGYAGGNECQVAQLGDGSLMLNIRNDHAKYRAVVISKDRGQSWQPHETSQKTLIEPNCNGSLIRIDYQSGGEMKHALIFSNPHSQKSRTNQTIQVSLNDGKTWPAKYHLELDEGRGAGYPSLTQIDAEHLGIVYEGSRAQLTFQKFRIADLLRGQ
jgi:sialidase-1